MSISSRCRRHSKRFSASVLLAALALVGVLAFPPGAASAWVLNQAQFDDGTCKHSLPSGTDPTFINSTTPWFLLYGDGNRSSYRIFIDGVSIGTFSSDSVSNVCISTTVPLSQGAHVLT